MSELQSAASRRKGFGEWALRSGIARRLALILRAAIVRYARAAPRAPDSSKLTILTVSGWGKGGTTRAVLNLAGYMKDSRQVEIISLWRTLDEPFFEHPDGVKVSVLDDLRPGNRPRGIHRLLGRLPSVLVHPGDHWATSFSLLSDIRLARKLRRRSGILLTTRPALNLIAGLLDPPGLVTIGQEQMHLGSHAPELKAAMPGLYKNLDAFVVLTEGAKRDYEELLGNALKEKGSVPISCIPNSARDLGEPADLGAKGVLAAGRLNEQKGFDWLLDAWAIVGPKHPGWTLRICGEGELREELEARASQLDNVELPGHADVAEEMSAASVFALSSRFEGFPLVLVEAMSKGMAVVSFDCPTGPADVIENGRNGLLVPLGDVDAFAAAVSRMIDDEELRQRCGPAAAETGRSFRMEKIGPLWEELFRQLQRGSPT